jgi:hypothetical protein
MARVARRLFAVLVLILATVESSGPPVRGDVTSGEVEGAIGGGVRFLRTRQRPDGSWPGGEGVTELATLAFLTAGVPHDDPRLARALTWVRGSSPHLMAGGHKTYTVALHTMVLAAADTEADRELMARDADWLVGSQVLLDSKAIAGRHRPGVAGGSPTGSWGYSERRGSVGDNSNTQYALLGLNAAVEAGIPIPAEVWRNARLHWLACQQADGGWSYHLLGRRPSTASMTTAGISSLIITGSHLSRGSEVLSGKEIRRCGGEVVDLPLEHGIDWLANHFSVQTNLGDGAYKLYYLYGLERAGRLTGLRYFGVHDWYREGARELVLMQNRDDGGWREFDFSPEVATSFALLFLAKGRAPVLINKLRHGTRGDWNNDANDIRNLVGIVSRDWKHLLTWQVVDAEVATPLDLLQAPIVYFNGHLAPDFDERGKRNLRDFVEQGGFILAEACCGRAEFDRRFQALMKEMFPEPGYDLHRLGADHAIWRARHPIDPGSHSLWGIELGCRTVVVYSPEDLSCYWNQAEDHPAEPAVVEAVQLGQNIVDYATGRELPDDKLAVRELRAFQADTPRRGALRIARLKYPGEWNVAPRAIPKLMGTLRKPPLSFDVVISQRALSPHDPSLVNYPLVYMHGRTAFDLSADLVPLRQHLEPGGGTIFADAACGSPAFDASFRRFVAALLPGKALVPIPHDDEIYTRKLGFDLSGVQYSPAAGGRRDFPALEGIKLDGHWAVIYSKYDLGCALDHHQSPECQGYTHESALQIAANIVIYATLP